VQYARAMIRKKAVLAVGLGLVALLLAAPLANAKQAKGRTGNLPDLVVAKASKPPTVTAGSTLQLTAKVRNKGTASAGKSRLGIYLAQKSKGKKHKKKSKGVLLKRVKVPALKAGKKIGVKAGLVLPADSAAGAYQLVVCADDTHKLHESKERDNCRRSKAFQVNRPAVPPVPTPTHTPTPTPEAAGRAAFALTNGIDWGFVEDAEGNNPEPGDPITATLTAANGISGQAGYARSDVAPQPLAGGTVTQLAFTSEDDGQATLNLPFEFPFGGIKQQTISVSTNGWVSFGSPAWDYWDDEQNNDYRGPIGVTGDVERGIMPYWADLNIGEPTAGSGSVKEVIAADGQSVAFQWHTRQCCSGSSPLKTFQLVLFSDGRFRFDYPDENEPGGNEAFIGYSLGAGAASVDAVDVNVKEVPTTSILFSPNPVPAAGRLAAGSTTVTLPAGSSLVSSDVGCALTTEPTALNEGLVTCSTQSLASGEQTTRAVTFTMPPDAPGETSPANFRNHGAYQSGAVALLQGREIDALTTNLSPATLTVEAKAPLLPQVGVAAEFPVEVTAEGGGLDEPRATFTLPAHTTLDSIEIANQAIPCTVPAGGQVTCELVSGSDSMEPVVTVTPDAEAAAHGLTLDVTAQALNAPDASDSVTSAPVAP
jgi:CARDB protein